MQARKESRIPSQAARAALESQATLATTLHVILLDAFGADIYEASAVEIWEAIKSQWDVDLADGQLDRLMALLTSLATDAFFEDNEAFVAVSLALQGAEVSADIEGEQDDPSAFDMLWALWEVTYNLGDERPAHELLSATVFRRMLHEMSDTAEEQEETGDPVVADLEEHKATLFRQLAMLGINPETHNYAEEESPRIDGA